ncbi:hypothetical protein BX666DRAFT_1879670 [Dichotomocladium elegans]|nr:hypothetical protein BX666DRAFT_1879670 [Dichotomocladium elegans]
MMVLNELLESIQLQTDVMVQALARRDETERQQALLFQQQAPAFAVQQEQLAKWAKQRDDEWKAYTQQRERQYENAITQLSTSIHSLYEDAKNPTPGKESPTLKARLGSLIDILERRENIESDTVEQGKGYPQNTDS